MGKKVIIMILLIINISLMIVGCTSKDIIRHHYVYKGENDNWYAEYTVKAKEIFREVNNELTYHNEVESLFILKYKGELSDLLSSRELHFSYKSDEGGGGANVGPPDRKVYIHKSSGNGMFESKDSIIEVTIDLDGNIEKFKLKTFKE